MPLFDVTSAVLEVAARASERRQAILANNLANVNTPGFKRSEIDFQAALARAISTGGPNLVERVHGVEISVKTDSMSAMRNDGNNVDVDREAAALAETQILYDAVMAMETKRMRTLSQVISGAR